MDEIMKGDAGGVAIFLYLLPGFVGMATYDYLVEGPKREVFDRIVFALSITLISSLIVGSIYGSPVAPKLELKADGNMFAVIPGIVGSWMARTTLVSTVLSLILAFLSNYGIPLWLARQARLTYKTSSVDVWQDVFYKFRGYWIRIAFKDGRVLVGFPRYFSAVGQPRELFIADATWWLKEADGTPLTLDVRGAGVYLANFDDVSDISLLT